MYSFDSPGDLRLVYKEWGKVRHKKKFDWFWYCRLILHTHSWSKQEEVEESEETAWSCGWFFEDPSDLIKTRNILCYSYLYFSLWLRKLLVDNNGYVTYFLELQRCFGIVSWVKFWFDILREMKGFMEFKREREKIILSRVSPPHRQKP